jgi:F1F0 ATPase subunit 2
MIEFRPLLIPFLAGVALGGFYFGSLWWVVRRVATMRQPELWLFASFLARAAVTVTGFFIVMGGRWERVAACMVGFVLARTVLIGFLHEKKSAIPTR